MSDIYVPGVKSRFNSEKIIEDLMKLEKVPKERVERNIENLESEKGYWQEVGRRVNSLRDSARLLYSFQNPFNERIAASSDESVITGIATREAKEQEYRFAVKQVAQADRFLSPPLEDSFRVENGTYTFTVGKDTISFDFKGGTLKEFTDLLNRRGRDKVGASLIAVQPGKKSLLIESKITGAENRLVLSADAEKLAISSGMAERVNNSRQDIPLAGLKTGALSSAAEKVTVNEGVLQAPALTSVSIPLAVSDPSLILKFDTASRPKTGDDFEIPQPPPGPAIPSSGSVSYGGIVVENDPSKTPLPEWIPPEMSPRVDNFNVLSLGLSDGSSVSLPPLGDGDFSSRQYSLAEIAGGKTVVSLNINNNNTHRDIFIRDIAVMDPVASGNIKPLNPISTAQDAIITMEGIEIKRPTNAIDDLIPGVTITARSPSERPVNLGIRPDREAVKDAIITLVGNYNRLMAEVNVLTRNDDKVIQELSYLNTEEQEAMRKRLGAFSGDSTLMQFRSGLQRAAAAPYPTEAERDLALLSQIGIGTDVRRSGGSYDPSRLRGYLEIDEKTLDAALETKVPVIQQLFGSDSNGDLIIDTGLAYSLETLTKPFVDTGGLITLKTGTIDSKISQDKRRIDTMERQLAAKEADLKVQYGRMEGAYNRMEQMQGSLDNFSRQSSANNGR